MIERTRDTQSFVYTGIILRLCRIHIPGFHERNQLTVSHVKEHVADQPALFDFYDVASNGFESQKIIVEVLSLIQIQG